MNYQTTKQSVIGVAVYTYTLSRHGVHIGKLKKKGNKIKKKNVLLNQYNYYIANKTYGQVERTHCIPLRSQYQLWSMH